MWKFQKHMLSVNHVIKTKITYRSRRALKNIVIQKVIHVFIQIVKLLFTSIKEIHFRSVLGSCEPLGESRPLKTERAENTQLAQALCSFEKKSETDSLYYVRHTPQENKSKIVLYVYSHHFWQHVFVCSSDLMLIVQHYKSVNNLV